MLKKQQRILQRKEYGNDSEIKEIVSLYGVATITGIGTEIGIELIIQGLM